MDNTLLSELTIDNDGKHMDDFLPDEIEQAIKNLKVNKVPGEDNITAEMIQAAGESSIKMMHLLYNKMYKEQQCPNRLGKSNYCDNPQEK